MAYKDKSKAIEYNNSFIAKAYDRINLTVSKGRKEIIQAHAEAMGTSVNGFINRAIEEAMERDKAAQAAPESPPGASDREGGD